MAEHSETAEVERQRIVAFIREEMRRYEVEVEVARRKGISLRDPSWTDYTAVVSKASMARVLAAYIERGDHMVPAARGDL